MLRLRRILAISSNYSSSMTALDGVNTLAISIVELLAGATINKQESASNADDEVDNKFLH